MAATRHKFMSGGQCVYEWEQSFEDVTVLIRPPEGVTAKHLAVSIQSNKVSVGIKGEKPFIDCETFQTVDSSTSTWTLSDGELSLILQKATEGTTWDGVFKGHEDTDTAATEADKKSILLERFQTEHPGFDFRGAEVTGTVPDASSFMQGMRK